MGLDAGGRWCHAAFGLFSALGNIATRGVGPVQQLDADKLQAHVSDRGPGHSAMPVRSMSRATMGAPEAPVLLQRNRNYRELRHPARLSIARVMVGYRIVSLSCDPPTASHRHVAVDRQGASTPPFIRFSSRSRRWSGSASRSTNIQGFGAVLASLSSLLVVADADQQPQFGVAAVR